MEDFCVFFYEFNVELKNRTDIDFALNQFEKLWDQSEDIKNLFIETLENKTWLNDKITPYELYLKTLFEYFYEDINIDKETSSITLFEDSSLVFTKIFPFGTNFPFRKTF